MKNTEAIKWLKAIKEKYIHGGDEWHDSKRKEAIDCAITVLGGEVKTNAERIRAMSDEELADWLEGVDCFYCDTCAYQQECRFEKDTETVNYSEKYSCKEGRTKWLKQPAEEDTE